MLEDHLYWLDQILPTHRLFVGDKAFYLGSLAQRGYRVVPGVVVSAKVFQSFIEQIQWTEPMFADLPNSSLHIDVDNSRQLQAIAQQIRQGIRSAPVPDSWLSQFRTVTEPWDTAAVILRASVALPNVDPVINARTAQLMDSIVCPPEPEAIATSLKGMWEQVFRAKNLLYCQRLGIKLQHLHLAVLIQPIQSVIASGDMQVDETYLELRSVWGLGQGLLTGEVMPDYYYLDRRQGEQSHSVGQKHYLYEIAVPANPTAPKTAEGSPLTHREGYYRVCPVEPSQQSQPALTANQVQELMQLAQQICTDLGTSVTVEWAVLPEDTATPIYVTQLTPHLPVNSRIRTRITAQRPGLVVGQHLNPLPGSGEQVVDAALLAGQPLPSSVSSYYPLTGLAAAPGKALAAAWVIASSTLALTEIPPGAIVVATSITPDQLISVKQAAGIITEQGGMTSHGAILARDMGIPAVTGVANATQLIRSGEQLFMDGDRGEIHRVEAADAGRDAKFHPQILSQTEPTFPSESPSATPIATQLFVSLSQPDAIATAARLPVDGVGLVRSELFLLDGLEHRHPLAWVQAGQHAELTQRLVDRLQPLTQAFAPRPVFYRSLDWRSHEFPHLDGSPVVAEPNPMLGLRGTFSYQMHPALFEIELQALKQLQHRGHDNIHLVLPFVRTVEEFIWCRRLVEQVGLTQQPHFQLWIMAEVPSILLLLPDYIQAGIQGIAIGSNDLTQLLLGVDRDQPQLASAFNQRHPAVTRAIQQIIQTARQAHIPCSICGNAPSQHLDLIDSLVRWGITAISVDVGEVERVRSAIERAERRLLLEAARQHWGSTLHDT